MTDNPRACNGAMFPLDDHRVIELAGRDATGFTQAQFMNDVMALAPGQWHWNGWLNPKGRVIALFALLRVDDECLWAVLPDADAAALAAQLRRFVFRSKLTITVRDEIRAHGAFEPPAVALTATLAGTPETGIELDMGVPGQPRTLRLAAVDTNSAADAAGPSAWRAVDLLCGLPRLPASEVERWTPQQLSLERLQAFSVKKGCYPGQEIVARTHFLGQAKRSLALFEADGAVAAGDAIEADGAGWGVVVSAAPAPQGSVVLGVGSSERVPDRASAPGAILAARPFMDGLAR